MSSYIFPVAMPGFWRAHPGLKVFTSKRSKGFCLSLGSQQVGSPGHVPWSYYCGQHYHRADHASGSCAAHWDSSSGDATQATWSVS